MIKSIFRGEAENKLLDSAAGMYTRIKDWVICRQPHCLRRSGKIPAKQIQIFYDQIKSGGRTCPVCE